MKRSLPLRSTIRTMRVSRRLALAGLALLMIHAMPFRASAQWAFTGPTGIGASFLTGVDFPHPNVGYAVGWASGQKGVLIKTGDGGANWKVQAADGVQFLAVHFLDSSRGFIAAYKYDCKCGSIYSTTNGGANWAEGTYAGATGFHALAFPDAQTGYVAGGNGAILKTTDGGANWVPLSTGTTDSFEKINFVSPTLGFALAIPGQFGRPSRLYRTTDGGTSWVKIQDYTNGRALLDVNFVSASVGFMAGGEGGPRVFKTTDGGDSWTPTTIDGPAEDVLQSILFVDASTGYAAGDNGKIVRTTDGGASWKNDNTQQAAALHALAFVNKSNGYAVGDFGGMLKRSGGADSPVGVLYSTGLDFEQVDLGDTKQLSFAVGAGNSFGLRIDTIYIENGDAQGFRVVAPSSYPQNVAEGQPLLVTVEFAPKAAGKVQNALVIRTNDGDAPEKQLPLVATGHSTASVAMGEAAELSDLIVTNPLHGRGSLSFSLAGAMPVRALLYDMSGREVKLLFDRRFEPGAHQAQFDLSTIPDGSYYCVVDVGGTSLTRLVTVIR